MRKAALVAILVPILTLALATSAFAQATAEQVSIPYTDGPSQ